MQAEQIAAVFDRIGKFLHGLPAAGFAACGQIVGMPVIIAGPAPAVQMQIKSAQTHIMIAADFLRARAERDDLVIPLRMFAVIIESPRGYVCFDAFVYNGAADQAVCQRIAGALFRQSGKKAGFFYISAVGFAEGVIITGGKKPELRYAAAGESAKAGQIIKPHAGARPAGRMVDLIAGVPGLLTDGKVSLVVLDLSEPWHIGVRAAELSVEGKRADFVLPEVRDQKPLHDGHDGDGIPPRALK